MKGRFPASARTGRNWNSSGLLARRSYSERRSSRLPSLSSSAIS
jgi:hypothetical protein